ncbi:MAG: GTP pyrophosphokinase [Proteocatella sp.]
MEYREWKKILLPYEYAVEELKVKFKNMRREFQNNGEYSPIEFVTGRIKKVTSILEKAKKLNMDVDKISTEMEDIAGIRVMCQLVDDIYTVVELIRTRTDMEVVYEKDYIQNYKESGYRSYHVIIKYPIDTIEGSKEILAEIQIRTLSMNFWATIEHSLKYKYNKDLPEDLSIRLRRAGDAAFILDKEMSEIREEIVKAQVTFGLKSMAVKESIDGIRLLHDMGYKHEALMFQEQLDVINAIDNIDALAVLQGQINNMINEKKQTEKEDV